MLINVSRAHDEHSHLKIHLMQRDSAESRPKNNPNRIYITFSESIITIIVLTCCLPKLFIITSLIVFALNARMRNKLEDKASSPYIVCYNCDSRQ